jgi:transposase
LRYWVERARANRTLSRTALTTAEQEEARLRRRIASCGRSARHPKEARGLLRRRREVFVPLTYRPGDLAEVDFFEVFVDPVGVRRKAFLFLMRLMYSGRDFAWIYERQDQVSFLDGHVRAFAHFGGVPG